jgi:hypothetical protein
MEAVLENPVCASCGAEVREGTSFCYACGKPVNGPPIDPPEDLEIVQEKEVEAEVPAAAENAELAAALSKAETDAAENAPLERQNSENRIRAARERRAARNAKRKPVRVEWAEPADANGTFLMLAAAVIFVISAIIVVYLEVYK